jgi:hypothetical protein
VYGHRFELEHICSYNVGLGMPPEAIGPVAEGLRLNIYLAGCHVGGPRLRGKVLPVRADWGTMRTDGVFVLDVRATIQTDDGALIYASYGGLIDAGPDGYQRMLVGELPPDGTSFLHHASLPDGAPHLPVGQPPGVRRDRGAAL